MAKKISLFYSLSKRLMIHDFRLHACTPAYPESIKIILLGKIISKLSKYNMIVSPEKWSLQFDMRTIGLNVFFPHQTFLSCYVWLLLTCSAWWGTPGFMGSLL